MNLSVIILAAGAGTRMRSSKPKVLHALAGKPLLEHVYNTSKKLGAEQVQVVYGHGGDQLTQGVTGRAARHRACRTTGQCQYLC